LGLFVGGIESRMLNKNNRFGGQRSHAVLVASLAIDRCTKTDSLWSTEGGLSLQTYLVDALHRYYDGRASASVAKALKDVGTN
jgi:hypothetical protein